MIRVGLTFCSVASAVAWLAACAPDGTPVELATPSVAIFEQEVYPLLLRDCGMVVCHGDTQRHLVVLGPGRERLDPEIGPLAAPTEGEVTLAYQRARSLIDLGEPSDSAFLLKPLATAAGGAPHQGVDRFGRDIYESTSDPRMQVLYDWANSHAAVADAEEAGGADSGTPILAGDDAGAGGGK